jgi:hypothetical protein
MHYEMIVNGLPLTTGDHQVTGRQVLNAASLHPVDEYALVVVQGVGVAEEIGPDELVNLTSGKATEFFAWKTDRLYYYSMDDRKIPWKYSVTELEIRKLFALDETKTIVFARENHPDRELKAGDEIQLGGSGVEHFYSKQKIWDLDVHGVLIHSSAPTIKVKDAMVQAGFDITKKWIMIFKVKGEPKRDVELETTLDLTTPGIERLRLMPDKINNGEAQVAVRREFRLLPKDEKYLDALNIVWETFVDGQRWLILRNYLVPVGYTVTMVDLAIDIPLQYPAAEIDMFYVSPSLARIAGGEIPQTQSSVIIGGITFQRWSRHRDPGVWSPENDSVLTHMSLVEESLIREINQ